MGRGWRWSALARRVRAEAGYRCEHCAVGSDRLEVDHILPVLQRPELEWERSNLEALCARCHRDKSRRDRLVRDQRRPGGRGPRDYPH